ncbi:hypothetical protein R2X38_24365 [Photobacterium rosenbergii]|uniref:Uncharacterized protein n=1 Tax=Photobacterium rosenbergii TaxID=294936 RepID=A0ABU3ZPU6_9GAMM|nr:hypothetical protein [Photobacterium rosenbergii]
MKCIFVFEKVERRNKKSAISYQLSAISYQRRFKYKTKSETTVGWPSYQLRMNGNPGLKQEELSGFMHRPA